MVVSWTRWGLLLLTGQLKSLQPKTRVRLSPACQDSHPRGADSYRTREPPDCENVPWNPCAPLDCAGIGYFWACYRLRVNRIELGPLACNSGNTRVPWCATQTAKNPRLTVAGGASVGGPNFR